MANIFRGLEGNTNYNTSNQEHVVDLWNINLTFMVS